VEEGTSFSAVQARERFADLVNRAAYRGERITLTRRGRSIATVVPIEDLQLLEQIEDRIDIREARKAIREGGKAAAIAPQGARGVSWKPRMRPEPEAAFPQLRSPSRMPESRHSRPSSSAIAASTRG
jgi:prevent-host-death family protein